jgi:hypothetical protein
MDLNPIVYILMMSKQINKKTDTTTRGSFHLKATVFEPTPCLALLGRGTNPCLSLIKQTFAILETFLTKGVLGVWADLIYQGTLSRTGPVSKL